MNLLYTLALYIFILGVHQVVCWNEVNVDGEIVKDLRNSEVERAVQFQSEYDETLNLYWIGNELDGMQEHIDPVMIVEIPPHGLVHVNTFDYHLFYASKSIDNVRAIPRKISIAPGKDLYVFQPNDNINSAKLSSNKGPSAKQKIIEAKDDDKTSITFIRPDAEVLTRNRDLSVNSGLHPAVTLLHSGTQAMSVKFRNLASGCDYYYDDGRDGIFQGRLELGGESTTNTYEGHVFYFTRVDQKDEVLARFTMHKDQVTYVVTDPKFLPPRHLQEHTDREKEFSAAYRKRTGIHWRHYFGPSGPRAPPVLYMWDAKAVGQVHRVTSEHGYWLNCDSVIESESSKSTINSLLGRLLGSAEKEVAPKSAHGCQNPQPLNLELEVISLQPRAFVIENFLSHFEADQIIQMSKNKLKASTVGNGDAGGARSDGTRTSKNTWLSRESSPLLDTLFRRAADLLHVDEVILHSDKNAEDMQVVNYVNGQKYDSHHDWGVSGYPESRYITLLLYLTDQPNKVSGGETAFPKAADGGGIKIHPGKGNAVLFYNLLEDGNGDDLALHAALPVKDGHEKWLANFWVWDAKRR